MNRQRPIPTVARLVLGFVLCLSLVSCAEEDSDCWDCVDMVRGCVDDADVCRWTCAGQNNNAECYESCIEVAKECALKKCP
jgi:hypothetical protein